jgi:hypothetical protein
MGLSKTFGVDPWNWYLTVMIPLHIKLLTPFAYLSVLYTHFKYQSAKGRTPYIAIYIVFYIFFFSLIAHKEIRFMLPIWSFVFVCIAEFWSVMMLRWTKLFSFILKLTILVEVITFLVIETQTQ